MTFEITRLPAASRRGKAQKPIYVEFAQFLRDNRCQWAVFPKEFASAAAARTRAVALNAGREASMRHGFEAAARNGKMYVRYIGGDQ